jgi:hypothetical protein
MPDLAISIRQPWVHFIFDLPADLRKDVENRSWPTKVRGRIWIHASKYMTTDDYDVGRDFAIQEVGVPAIEITYADQLPKGVIVGSARILDCITESSSPWFVGEYGFMLMDPIRLAKPVSCAGALGFWRVPSDVLARLGEAA